LSTCNFDFSQLSIIYKNLKRNYSVRREGMGGNDISKNESKVDDNNSSSEEDCLDG
jgi:hypothetical protein